jgi:hypothetical protein
MYLIIYIFYFASAALLNISNSGRNSPTRFFRGIKMAQRGPKYSDRGHRARKKRDFCNI